MRLDAGQIEVVDDDVAMILRAKSPAERLQIANGMWHSAQVLIGSSLRAQHPDWDEGRVTAETAKRLAHGSC